jgi:hypothetical protein
MSCGVRVTIMVSGGNGYGVKVTVMVSGGNGYGVAE